MEAVQRKYTEKQIDEKIELLVGNVQGEEKYKVLLRNRLTAFVGLMPSIGEDIVMRMPEDVRYVFKDAEEMEKKETKALYEASDRTITLRDNAFLQDQSDFIISLAHEMRHAIQDADGLFSTHSVIPNQLFVFKKLCEIEAKLQNIIIESKFKTRYGGYKSGPCQFYEAEVKRFKQEQIAKKHGNLTKEQDKIIQAKAEERAKSEIVRLYWSGLFDDLKGDSQNAKSYAKLSDSLKDDIEGWTQSYDRQALEEMRSEQTIYDHPEQMLERVSSPDFPKDKQSLRDFMKKHLKASLKIKLSHLNRKFGANQTFESHVSETDFSGEDTGVDMTREKIAKYTEKMGIRLSPSFFTTMQESTSFVAPGFVIRYYPNDGTRKSELFSLGENKGFVFRAYSPVQAFQKTSENESITIGKLEHEAFYDDEGRKHNIETERERGTSKYHVFPWNHGEKSGYEFTIDEHGVIISKELYKDGDFIRSENPTEEEKKEKSLADVMKYAKELHEQFMTDKPEERPDVHAASDFLSHRRAGGR